MRGAASVWAAQRPARRLCFALARGGAYCFGGGGNGSRTGSLAAAAGGGQGGVAQPAETAATPRDLLTRVV
jgi:hypothetical protein